MEPDLVSPGLTDKAKSDWPAQIDENIKPIDVLKPNSPEHARVISYLKNRLESSERKMAQFYPRWRALEKRMQAYINPDVDDQLRRDHNDEGYSPLAYDITVPYMFATIATIVTYHMHTFLGRRPIFQVGTYRSEFSEASLRMQTKLQYDADHSRLARHLYQYLRDGEIYGVGVMQTAWAKEEMYRTVWRPKQYDMFMGAPTGASAQERVKEFRTTFEGNTCRAIDPYMFFPDPNVPMAEVCVRGEFAFWRQYQSKHTLLLLEKEGKIKYVKDASPTNPHSQYWNTNGDSNRTLRSMGDSNPGAEHFSNADTAVKMYQVDQGTAWIVPKELGIGAAEVPELWIFTILNKSQIVQAEPFTADHQKHPVHVSEPYGDGYSFGNMGSADHLGELQDLMSWLINSHIQNVRVNLNNMMVVDPSRIEMQDLKRPGPGKIIRLKRSAFGQDVQTALSQLKVQDVTRGHFDSLALIMRIADATSGVNDNLRAVQSAGGRKTATEVRTAADAGASRLAASSRIISSQGISDMTEQWSLNNQQWLSEDFALTVLGKDMEGMKGFLPINSGSEVTGDFYYPIHDGTLPIDRVAMLDVWKEIFLATAQDAQLRQEFDIKEMFKFMADLAGAKNLEQFERQQPSGGPENLIQEDQGQIDAQVQQGNLVPIKGGQTPGIAEDQGARLLSGSAI